MSNFWTDAGQAQQRLNGSVVMHRDGPAYIRDIDGAVLCYILPDQNSHRIPLDDPGWHDYRDLPKLGWVNHHSKGMAVFMERRPRRNSTHGLCDQNVTVLQSIDNNAFVNAGGFTNFIFDTGFADATAGKYEDIREVLSYLKDRSIIGISNRYAVGKDDLGIPYLLRGTKKVGVIIEDTIRLPDSVSYLREELLAEDALKLELKSF